MFTLQANVQERQLQYSHQSKEMQSNQDYVLNDPKL